MRRIDFFVAVFVILGLCFSVLRKLKSESCGGNSSLHAKIIQNLQLLERNFFIVYSYLKYWKKWFFQLFQGLKWIHRFDLRLLLRFAATKYYVNSCETGIVHQKARMITLFLNFCSSSPLKRDIIKARTLKNTQALMKRKKFETFWMLTG